MPDSPSFSESSLISVHTRLILPWFLLRPNVESVAALVLLYEPKAYIAQSSNPKSSPTLVA
jgi:hypothetical protein